LTRDIDPSVQIHAHDRGTDSDQGWPCSWFPLCGGSYSSGLITPPYRATSSVFSNFTIRKAIQFMENGFLLLIALFTVIGMFQEIYSIVSKRSVALQDLLLMFIYVEVLAMVGAYYESKQIPITLPLFIAITAIARLTILQGKEQPPINLILEAGAILILACASVVVTYRSNSTRDTTTD
jgi:protein PsiE